MDDGQYLWHGRLMVGSRDLGASSLWADKVTYIPNNIGDDLKITSFGEYDDLWKKIIGTKPFDLSTGTIDVVDTVNVSVYKLKGSGPLFCDLTRELDVSNSKPRILFGELCNPICQIHVVLVPHCAEVERLGLQKPCNEEEPFLHALFVSSKPIPVHEEIMNEHHQDFELQVVTSSAVKKIPGLESESHKEYENKKYDKLGSCSLNIPSEGKNSACDNYDRIWDSSPNVLSSKGGTNKEDHKSLTCSKELKGIQVSKRDVMLCPISKDKVNEKLRKDLKYFPKSAAMEKRKRLEQDDSHGSSFEHSNVSHKKLGTMKEVKIEGNSEKKLKTSALDKKHKTPGNSASSQEQNCKEVFEAFVDQASGKHSKKEERSKFKGYSNHERKEKSDSKTKKYEDSSDKIYKIFSSNKIYKEASGYIPKSLRMSKPPKKGILKSSSGSTRLKETFNLKGKVRPDIIKECFVDLGAKMTVQEMIASLPDVVLRTNFNKLPDNKGKVKKEKKNLKENLATVMKHVSSFGKKKMKGDLESNSSHFSMSATVDDSLFFNKPEEKPKKRVKTNISKEPKPRANEKNLCIGFEKRTGCESKHSLHSGSVKESLLSPKKQKTTAHSGSVKESLLSPKKQKTTAHSGSVKESLLSPKKQKTTAHSGSVKESLLSPKKQKTTAHSGSVKESLLGPKKQKTTAHSGSVKESLLSPKKQKTTAHSGSVKESLLSPKKQKTTAHSGSVKESLLSPKKQKTTAHSGSVKESLLSPKKQKTTAHSGSVKQSLFSSKKQMTTVHSGSVKESLLSPKKQKTTIKGNESFTLLDRKRKHEKNSSSNCEGTPEKKNRVAEVLEEIIQATEKTQHINVLEKFLQATEKTQHINVLEDEYAKSLNKQEFVKKKSKLSIEFSSSVPWNMLFNNDNSMRGAESEDGDINYTMKSDEDCVYQSKHIKISDQVFDGEKKTAINRLKITHSDNTTVCGAIVESLNPTSISHSLEQTCASIDNSRTGLVMPANSIVKSFEEADTFTRKTKEAEFLEKMKCLIPGFLSQTRIAKQKKPLDASTTCNILEDMTINAASQSLQVEKNAHPFSELASENPPEFDILSQNLPSTKAEKRILLDQFLEIMDPVRLTVDQSSVVTHGDMSGINDDMGKIINPIDKDLSENDTEVCKNGCHLKELPSDAVSHGIDPYVTPIPPLQMNPFPNADSKSGKYVQSSLIDNSLSNVITGVNVLEKLKAVDKSDGNNNLLPNEISNDFSTMCVPVEDRENYVDINVPKTYSIDTPDSFQILGDDDEIHKMAKRNVDYSTFQSENPLEFISNKFKCDYDSTLPGITSLLNNKCLTIGQNNEMKYWENKSFDIEGEDMRLKSEICSLMVKKIIALQCSNGSQKIFDYTEDRELGEQCLNDKYASNNMEMLYSGKQPSEVLKTTLLDVSCQNNSFKNSPIDPKAAIFVPDKSIVINWEGVVMERIIDKAEHGNRKKIHVMNATEEDNAKLKLMAGRSGISCVGLAHLDPGGCVYARPRFLEDMLHHPSIKKFCENPTISFSILLSLKDIKDGYGRPVLMSKWLLLIHHTSFLNRSLEVLLDGVYKDHELNPGHHHQVFIPELTLKLCYFSLVNTPRSTAEEQEAYEIVLKNLLCLTRCIKSGAGRVIGGGPWKDLGSESQITDFVLCLKELHHSLQYLHRHLAVVVGEDNMSLRKSSEVSFYKTATASEVILKLMK